MASTSSSKRTSSPSSSSNSKWRYDVFLSFRGEDTRKNFTDHLYSALDRANIQTFRDDEELPRGEEIAPELLKAIEESRIAIIVFSKTYAHSKWCLDELVKIIECKKEKGQTVFPIFYHVEPSEVRNQTGIYGEAFNNHERNADEEKKQKIEKWKTALKTAGNFSGFPLQDRSEAKFIEEIIGEIRRLIPKWVHVGENIVGINENLEKVKLMIDTKPNEVSMVGIYGIGGIGKTTIAKVIYNDMLDQFKRHSFLENVREKSKDDYGLLQLQEKLLCDVLMEKNLKLRNVDEGIEMIKSKCHLEKVLLVLDDVDHPEQLKFLAPNSEWFHRGSIIIVTTRDKRCLDVHKSYSSYEAKGLAHDQAMELFSWNAFQKHHPKDNYVDLSNRILDYAKGLPLALVVLGSYLFQRDVHFWKSTLQKLKTNPLEDIQKVLQISYDGLDDTNKKLFLDIACFFKDKDKKFVTRILEACDLHARIGLSVLDERCLISMSGGKIRMHDLLQEMGWAIVRQNDPKQPGKWSRLWEYEDIKSVFTKNTGTKNIEGIFLYMNREKSIQLTAEAFRKMNRLRFLKVECDPIMEQQLSLDFKFPCHDLVYFHWNNYPLESLPSSFHAENLGELNLVGSNIKHLWKGNMRAKKLKVINLSYSKHLVDISSISNVPNLEILILDGCRRLESLPGNLHKLEFLQTLSCDGCSKMKSFTEIKGNMGRLRVLKLGEMGIIELSSSIRHLHGLENLNLRFCTNLVSLSDNICSLNSLRTLSLFGCSKLKDFPDINIGSLKALESLFLSYCNNLESLPVSICNLSSLKNFCLNECSKLKSFPAINIGSLKALEWLDLSGWKNLESLPVSICNLSSLKTLNLNRCSKLKSFPDINIGSLKALEWLVLSGCNNLESLPVSICNLSSLKIFYLDGCSKLKSFPDINIGSLKALEWLVLSGCKNLESLPVSICNLSFLKNFYLDRCLKLKSFPDINIGSLKALKCLDLSGCKNLENLPVSICNLSSLKALNLDECSKLKSFSDINIGSLKALEWLNLSGCKNLESLPVSICNFSSLKTLNLDGCSKLKSFPDINIGSLKALESLHLSSCKSLESLPMSICNLSSLKTLKLDWCSKLKSFPDINIGSLKALESLDLSGCKNLESLPVSICNLSSLKTLRVKDCPKLEGILKVSLQLSVRSNESIDSSCGILKSGVIWSNDCFSSLKTLNPQCDPMKDEILAHICPLSSLVELSVRNSHLRKRDILNGSFDIFSLQISSRNFHPMKGRILCDIFHLSSLRKLCLSKCNLMEAEIPHDIWNLSSLVQLSLSNCNLMEGEILNHVCLLSSLEKLSLEGNRFSRIPAGINQLSNLRALNLSDCKKLQEIPELPSSLRFLDAHDCSDCISSSPSILPIHSVVNYFQSKLMRGWTDYVGDSLFGGPGMSIVVPRSSGTLDWIRYQSMGSDEVAIELPPNWYENNDLLGFALCCVYVALDDKFDYQCEDPSAHESQNESAHTYENESDNGSAHESENGESLKFYCDLSIRRNNQSADVIRFSIASFSGNDGGSDIMWVIYYPKVAIKERYNSNQWTPFMASFYGCRIVEECGIRLIYAKDYEQNHPTMAQGSIHSLGIW